MSRQAMAQHRNREHLLETVGGEDSALVTGPDVMRRVGIGSFIGSLVEWYDFFLYGLAAALVFGQQFFPPTSPLIGTLSAFATFAVGFAARPLGGVIFGHLGDRVGRKSSLVITLLLMGTATFLLGLLPTYAQVGLLAPVLLVLLRLLQGVAVGGEWGGAILMIVEHAPPHRRGFYGSWPQMASSAALLLATGLNALFSTVLPQADFQTWGWRLPFLFSIVLIAVGLFIRMRVPESPEFEQVKQAGTQARRPVLEAISKEHRSILLVIGMRMVENAAGYLISVFALAYVTGNLQVASQIGLLANMVAAGVQFCITPLYGALSDRIGRRPIYLFGAVLHMVLAFPFFWLLDTRNPALIVLAFVLGYAVANGALFATQPAFFSELFGTRVRYSGISIGYQFSAIFAGGLAPFIATALTAASGGQPWLVAGYYFLVAAITFVTTLVARETRVAPTAIPGPTPAARRAA
jgi:MFS transporter, MHS family, shikimate and dehydroshikimate transport protein